MCVYVCIINVYSYRYQNVLWYSSSASKIFRWNYWFVAGFQLVPLIELNWIIFLALQIPPFLKISLKVLNHYKLCGSTTWHLSWSLSTKKERKRNIYKSSGRAAPIGPWYITNVLRSRRRENLLSKTSKEENVQHFPILTFALQKGQRGGGQIPFQISKTN